MGVRGRTSAAALSVVTALKTIRRPDPPQDLTDEQSVIWRAVVDSMAADWFGAATFPLLVQLCRHVVTAGKVAQLQAAEEASEDFDIKRYDRILKMAEREARCIASLSVKLRISQSTTYDERKNRVTTPTKRPWEDDE